MLLLVFFNQGKPFFLQRRPGKDGRIFTIIKFKTMNDKKDTNGKLLSDAERLTKIGNFVRKTSLDELPQLFNILENKMSLVGPRPLLLEYLNKYSNYEKKRHLVKPGITGLAQVNPELSGVKSWHKSIKLDIYYAKNVSFILDIRILFKTIELILFKKKLYKDFKKFYE
jgi:lipopolysaccharide/colanic/teichoic acid biosynthesis glycosyltransferase